LLSPEKGLQPKTGEMSAVHIVYCGIAVQSGRPYNFQAEAAFGFADRAGPVLDPPQHTLQFC
jgi:hypothetical protein